LSVLVRPGDIVCTVRENDPTALTPGLVRELRPVIYCDKYLNLIGYAYGTMHQWAPLFVIGSLVLLPFCLFSPARGLAVFLTTAYAYDVAGNAVFGSPTERYWDVFILLPVMLACLGAHFAISTLAARRCPSARQ